MANDITRREFLELSGKMAVLLGLGLSAAPKIAEALEELAAGSAPVLWLQGQSCSGCSVSLLNSDSPSVAELLTSYISLQYHSTISAATGAVAMGVINTMVAKGGYVLVAEGAVPAGMPSACRVGEELYTEQVVRVAKKAAAVIAVGACAAYGGIPAAENNPTGAIAVAAHLKKNGVNVPVINIPGCPAHPDWLVGTVVHVLKFGIPDLNDGGAPSMFYRTLVHDQCNFFTDYESQRFATKFGEPGCLFKLGCAGPITKADCPLRQWNSGSNWCIKQGAPCIGCASPNFCAKASYPLVTIDRAINARNQQKES